MIIPVRCFTCGKILGDKWEQYNELKSKYKNSSDDTIINIKKCKKNC